MPHDDHNHHNAPLSEIELRVKALESVLIEKNIVDAEGIDEVVQHFETRVGPRKGAQVVAKAWTDPAFKEQLLKDANSVLGPMGMLGVEGADMVVVENTDNMHHMVVCTLCSCYPWPMLGLPPKWYKSAAYRSRAVKNPRSILAEFGVTLPEDKTIQVWDSTAEIRYFVLPQRPKGTEGMSEDALAEIVTRDSMIGTGLVTV